MPPNYGRRAVDFVFLFRMFLNELFDLLARESLRIESATEKHRLLADKRLVFVDQIVARGIDPEIPAQLHVARIRAPLQRLVQRQRFRIDLAPVDALQVLAGLDELSSQLAIFHGEARRQRHLYRAKARHTACEVGRHFDVRGFGLLGCRADHPFCFCAGRLMC